MAFVLPLIFCLTCGFFLVQIGLQSRMLGSSERLLTACLTIGFGLGIFSVTFFLSLLLQNTRLIVVDVAMLLLLCGVFLGRRFRAASTQCTVEQERVAHPAWVHRLLTGAFVTALCAALYSAVMRTLTYPQGDGWDAFAIWNLHARFLYRGGRHWCDGITALLPWSHPDYPLLLPAAVAHFWTYLGHDTPVVPAAIGFLFTFSTVGLLFSALSILRGRAAAMLGTMALLSTPSFIELGTSQYADVPLSFFFLAAIALLCLHDYRAKDDASPSTGLLQLSGLAAAFAAWTKNEGLLFVCAMLLARFLLLLRRDRPHAAAEPATRFAPLLMAAIPVLFLVVYFKRFIAPPGDLFSDPSSTLHKLLTPARYWAVIQWYGKEFFRFGHWRLIPATLLAIAYYFAVGKEGRGPQTLSFRISRLALVLTLAGYFVIYLITPYDIYWHLRFSLTRLFLQLWPSAIFLYFLLVKLQPPKVKTTSLTS